MDVNGLPFRLISGAADFGLAGSPDEAHAARHLALSDPAGHLRLASEQPPPSVREDETFARTMISSAAPVADPLGGFAWWNAGEARIEASGFAAGSIEIPLAAGSGPGAPSAMMLGADDILYVARGGALVWHDLRSRWPDTDARHPRLRPDLLAPAPSGGGWAFDRTNRRLMRVRGRPLRFEGLRAPDPAQFAPAAANRDPPRLTAVAGSGIDNRFDAVSLACSPAGRLALLAWESAAEAALFLFGEGGFSEFGRLSGLRFPFSLAWAGEDHVAVMASDGPAPARQAFVYAVSGSAAGGLAMVPDGRVHRLLQPWHGGFASALWPVPRYLRSEGEPATPVGINALRPVSGSLYAREGRVLVGPIDSGVAGCVWHRVYVEAALADGTAIDLQLHAADGPDTPPLPAGLEDPQWALHRILSHPRDDTPAATPIAAWLPQQSEVANAPAMLGCPPRADRSGLFTLLVQQPGRKVRRVEGRNLWILLTLRGDGLGSPELAAIRVYAGRRSWRDTYLPSFYGEALSGSDAATAGPATPNDFMERFLHSAEGALTELEGRIAESWQLTDPATAPEPALPWIGQWIGVQSTKGEATARMRQRLLAAPSTAALSGTMGGLLAALELATGGELTSGRIDPGRSVPVPGEIALARRGDLALRGLMLSVSADGGCAFLAGGSVTRGDIVAVEGFRLRRTFATILGADLSGEADPLTLGMGVSGNSFVGDSLILGDSARSELLALYGPEIDEARADSEAVASFYERLAWRVMVLVRGVADDTEFRRIRRIAEAEVPAHVEALVHHARDPLIVGAASLVGLDTYLAAPDRFERVRLGETVIGEGDFVAGSGALDSRADGPVPRAPTARADGPPEVWIGNGFTLSGLASRAAERRRIERYIWMWDEEP